MPVICLHQNSGLFSTDTVVVVVAAVVVVVGGGHSRCQTNRQWYKVSISEVIVFYRVQSLTFIRHVWQMNFVSLFYFCNSHCSHDYRLKSHMIRKLI